MGTLASIGVSSGLLTVGPPGTASAEPLPPPGTHEACDNIGPKAMQNIHQGMTDAGGQMGAWMTSNEDCPHGARR